MKETNPKCSKKYVSVQNLFAKKWDSITRTMYPSIVIIPTQGLCNRLRAIVSAHILAKHYETTVYMIWNPEECCNCGFNDLFMNTVKSIELNAIHSKKYVYNPSVHTEKTLRETPNLEELDYIVVQGGHEFKSPTMSEEEFIREKHLFYKQLICVPDIENYVTDLTSNWFQSDRSVVGVHFRDFIEKHDEADGRNFAKESPIDSFVTRIREIHRSDSSVQFYVSSNSKLALETLQRRIPTANFIVESNVELNRYSVTGIKHALQSLIMISKTRYIVGTYMSSFSDEASFFRLIPKECIGMRIQNSYHCYGYSFVFGKPFLLPDTNLVLRFSKHDQ